ncbi:MAG: S-layer homology domain-containing protein [Candidatus Peribacteraceae bacterium]|nr:S-layer homology domain-containing protein [Candidatus Peribacteraceae bacterium]
MRKFLVSLLFLAPAVAFAFDYTVDVSNQYKDAPFRQGEAVAISFLTRMNVVGGNPDGTFAPNRTLNRAEFTKIAMLSHPDIAVSPSDAANCFPDVRASDWFSRYVCLAQKRGIVQGNPDGKFHPEREVNYAEATKILFGVFDLSVEEFRMSGDSWFSPYLRAADTYNIALGGSVFAPTFLTRGQMAMLAARMIAYANNDLTAYEWAEYGWGTPPSSSSSSSRMSSSSTSSSSSISTSSSSSSTSSSLSHNFPARSHFLVAGERSQPIASATFFANLEPMLVKRAEILLEDEIEGIDGMYIVAADGTELGQIFLDKIFDSNEKTWRGTLSGNYRIEKGEQKVIGVEVRMKARDQGGTSEELVEVDSFKIIVEGEWTGNTVTSGTDAGPHPQHQTSMGRITSVTNAQEASGVLPLGPNSQLASFTITGSAVQGVTLKIEHLTFNVSASSLIAVTNWKLTIPGSGETWPCSFNGGDSAVSCSSLPDSLGTFSVSRTFRLSGDVTLNSGSTDKNMQISLSRAGNLITNGSVRWTDETGHFNWVELDEPLARSTRWE